MEGTALKTMNYIKETDLNLGMCFAMNFFFFSDNAH